MKKPIIKLFHTPNGRYFYDAVMSEILPVAEDSYHYLCDWLAGQQGKEPPKEILQLQLQGYLSTESPVQTVQHAYTKYLPLILDRKLDHITLQVTQNCNFRCKYCIYSESSGDKQRHHSPKKMSWETAKQAMDYLWEHSIDSQEISISFYGGEPLLEFPLICRCIDYARQRFRDRPVRFNLTTNSTLMTDEMIHYFARNDVDVMISLDGPKEINDKNRVFAGGKGTFDTVMARVARIKELEPEFAKKLYFSMVMDPTNDFDCINAIEVECNAVTLSSLMPSIVEHLNEEDQQPPAEDFTAKFAYQEFLAWLAHFERYPKEKLSPITYKAQLHTLSLINKSSSFLPLQPMDCPSGPCIAGRTRLFCNADGDLFPCERVSETSKAMLLGNIYTGIDPAAADRLLNFGKLTAEKCRNCWAFRYCTLCAKKADDGSACLSAEEKVKNCRGVQADVANTLYGKL